MSPVTGRAIAQAVSRWLPTEVTLVRSRGFVDKVALGRFYQSTSVSSANYFIIHHQELVK
jgi:hypothetical protein